MSVSILVSVLASEAALRAIDGFELFSMALRKVEIVPAPAPVVRPDLRHVESIALAPGVDQSWYGLAPDPIATRPLDAAAQQRLDRYPTDPVGAFLVWNPNYVREQLCAGNRAGSLGILADFYVFDPVEDEPYPSFRHMPHFGPPGWFFSNAFGWRGPELTLEKPPKTIRIAFVGASTTVSAFGAPFSHPELIGHWLNAWAASRSLAITFEVINAGRMGIESASIAAIVRQEVAPLDPELVVYYEGANQFAPGKTLRMPAVIAPAPRATFQPWKVESYSALAIRVSRALSVTRGGNGAEPAKPPYPTVWPLDVNEEDPDVTKVPLPMDLDVVVANLDSIERLLRQQGSELAMSSFIWMVYPGMVLNVSRHLNLYRYLNDSYWPATYAHLRRMADFQNRVFANFAERHGLVFLDVAKEFPRDPDLFGDAIHMTEDGLRLQAWTYFQELVPLIEGKITAGVWPKPVSRVAIRDPADYSPHLVHRNDFLGQCR